MVMPVVIRLCTNANVGLPFLSSTLHYNLLNGINDNIMHEHIMNIILNTENCTIRLFPLKNFHVQSLTDFLF